MKMKKITNYKIQITNKLQITNYKLQTTCLSKKRQLLNYNVRNYNRNGVFEVDQGLNQRIS